jgi:hypothetical protein
MGYSANTEILLRDSRKIDFVELIRQRRQKGTALDIKTGQMEPAELLIPRVCGNHETMRVVRMKCGSFAATADQKVLLEGGIKIEVGKLKPGMSLHGIRHPGIDPEHYTVTFIVFEEKRGDSHTLIVPRYGNFALGCGVFVCD